MPYLRGSKNSLTISRDALFCPNDFPEFIEKAIKTEELPNEIHNWSYPKVISFCLLTAIIYISWCVKQWKSSPASPKRKSNKHLDPEIQSQSTRTSPEALQNKSLVRRAIRHGLCNIGNTCHM